MTAIDIDLENAIPGKAIRLIGSWRKTQAYLRETLVKYAERCAEWEDITGRKAYDLQAPAEKSHGFFEDHVDELIRLAEVHFGIGGVPLQLNKEEVKKYANHYGALTKERAPITDERFDLERVWREIERQYANPTAAREKACRTEANEILEGFWDFSVWAPHPNGRPNYFNTDCWGSVAVRQNNLAKAWKTTKAWKTIPFKCYTDPGASYNTDKRPSWKYDSQRKLASFVKALIAWAKLDDIPQPFISELEDFGAQFAFDNRKHFDYGDRPVNTKVLRIIVRKSQVEFAINHPAADKLTAFLHAHADKLQHNVEMETAQ